MGPTAGVNDGRIVNPICIYDDLPAEPHCTGGWIYHNGEEWVDDHTIYFDCKGNIHSRRQYNIFVFLISYRYIIIGKNTTLFFACFYLLTCFLTISNLCMVIYDSKFIGAVHDTAVTERTETDQSSTGT